MTAEIVVYAIIAAGLVFWLRSILGTRGEDEHERPAPKMELDQDGKVIVLSGTEEADTSAARFKKIEDLAAAPNGNMHIADKAAENGMIEIAKIDRDFDILAFLRAAQDAFVYIVESFADGDRETLKDLLGKEVYAAFDQALSDRERAGEVMETEIHAIDKAEIVETRMERSKALVTIRFWAQETSVVKDEDGAILSGHPERTTVMRDVWTFQRDLKGRDPRWLVVETREDGPGDNEIIPNTH